MGCFNNKTSDIDLIVEINNDISDKEKSQYINMIVKLNDFVLN